MCIYNPMFCLKNYLMTQKRINELNEQLQVAVKKDEQEKAKAIVKEIEILKNSQLHQFNVIN